ncbi:hypothetical protein [Shimia ponticola]|uniref:hypothetical protein n=1 Tax=Shimia ponticola TaxID=2582893 RepID=UPI00164B16E1|nr:hypothetical protein [Shimia ponticola]
MRQDLSEDEKRERRRKKRALRTARNNLADPNSKLGRLMTAYFRQQASDRPIMTLPEA